MKSLFKKLLFLVYLAVVSVVLLEVTSGAVLYTLYVMSGKTQYTEVTQPHPLFATYENFGNPIPPYARYDASNPFAFDARTGYWNKLNATYAEGLKIDSNGFVCNAECDPIERKKPEDELRIFIFGGSSVVGSGVSDGALTISGQLEKMLNARSDKPVKVINAGLGGGFSPLATSRFVYDAVLYDPDLVIFFNGHNDYRQWEYTQNPRFTHGISLRPNYSMYDYTLDKSFKELQSLSGSMKHFVRKATYFLPIFHYTKSLALNVLTHARMGTPLIADQAQADTSGEPAAKEQLNDGPSYADVQVDEVLKPTLLANEINSVTTYVANMKSAGGIARSHGIKALLCFQPTLGYPKKKKMIGAEVENWKVIYQHSPMIEQYYELVTQQFGELEKQNDGTVNFCDATNIFADVEDEIYWDNMHYTQEANRLIAEYLAAQLSGMLP